MDYLLFGFALVSCLFTGVLPKSDRCNDQQYWEPHKGCKNCSNVCRGRSNLECNWYCPNWGNIQYDKPKVPEAEGPPIKVQRSEAPGENSSAVVPPVYYIVPIVVVVVFLLVVPVTFIYWKKRARTNNVDRVRNVHQENYIEIPLNDIPVNNATPKTKQAVIMVDRNNQESIFHEEANAKDVDGLPAEGEVHVSQGSSTQSIYELSKEATDDANRIEPDFSSSVFCQSQDGMRLPQLIMVQMPNTDLRCFDQPTASEVNKDGRESEGATSSLAEPPVQPRLTRVPLYRASGGHQNQFFSQQESPAGRLEETSAVQPSREDTTQKYYISAQTNSEPYISERLNELQGPTIPQGPLPNGIDTYHHPNVNSMFADAGYEHYDQTSDNNDPQ